MVKHIDILEQQKKHYQSLSFQFQNIQQNSEKYYNSKDQVASIFRKMFIQEQEIKQTEIKKFGDKIKKMWLELRENVAQALGALSRRKILVEHNFRKLQEI